MAVDSRGLTLTGANSSQAKTFDDIVGSYLDYKLTTFPELKKLCEEAPNFAMAHIFKGLLLLSMGVIILFKLQKTVQYMFQNLIMN